MAKEKRKRKKKITDILAVSIISVIMLIFTLYAVHDIALCVQTKSGHNCEYIGSFELSESRRTRNTTYKFTLANGDVVTANPAIMENCQSLEEYDELKFSYTSFRNITFFAHTAVSITTTDGEIVFLSANDTLSDAKLGVWAYAIIIGIIATIIIAGCVVWRRVSRRPKKKK